MAGHSLGGIYARDFALRYPDDISGIVLVDSSHESQSLRTPEELKQRQAGSLRVMRPMMQVCAAATFTGLVRTVRFWHLTTRNMTEDARAAYTVTRNRTRFCSAMRDSISIFHDLMGRSAPPQNLGNIPLIVLGHGKSAGRTPAEKEWELTWHVLQRELAALSSEGSYRVVGDAGHMIPIDNPDAVTDAILEMVTRVRGSETSAKVD